MLAFCLVSFRGYNELVYIKQIYIYVKFVKMKNSKLPTVSFSNPLIVKHRPLDFELNYWNAPEAWQ